MLRIIRKFSLGLCTASGQRNAVYYYGIHSECISSFANAEDVQSRRKFAVGEIFRGSLLKGKVCYEKT